jgi:polyhydroxyalkanoate synthesis regulator phasin
LQASSTCDDYLGRYRSVQAFCNDVESYFQSFEDDLEIFLNKDMDLSEEAIAELEDELSTIETLQDYFESTKDQLILE